MALVTPDGRSTRAARAAVERLRRVDCVRMSLDRYASDRDAPLSIVVCPEGRASRADLEFLDEVRRRLLRPLPSSELWSAIAGLRGSHDPPPAGSPPPRSAKRRRTALLLEGDVTTDRARGAAASGSPRDWIVERVQSIRVPADVRNELEGLGIRWCVLDPVEVRAVVATPALLRARSRWKNWFPGAEVWKTDPRRPRAGLLDGRQREGRSDRDS